MAARLICPNPKLSLRIYQAKNAGGRKFKEVGVQDELHISGLEASI